MKDSSLRSRFFSRRKQAPYAAAGEEGTEESSHFFQNGEAPCRRVTRRFPGPAGLLPPINRENRSFLQEKDHPFTQSINHLITKQLEEQRELEQREMEEALGLALTPVPPQAPWNELCSFLKLDEEVLSKLTIKWVKGKVSRLPTSMKIPFLALVVQEKLESASNNGRNRRVAAGKKRSRTLKLMDGSGSIRAAVESGVLDLLGSEVLPGTAIAVANVGFLRFKRQTILTITRKNLLCAVSIRDKNSDQVVVKEQASRFRNALEVRNGDSETSNNTLDSSVNTITKETEDGEISISSLRDYDREIILQSYENVMTKLAQKTDQRDLNERPTTSTSLFSTIARPDTSSSVAPEDEESSVFGDEDDEDLLRALESADFSASSDVGVGEGEGD